MRRRKWFLLRLAENVSSIIYEAVGYNRADGLLIFEINRLINFISHFQTNNKKLGDLSFLQIEYILKKIKKLKNTTAAGQTVLGINARTWRKVSEIVIFGFLYTDYCAC